MKIAYKVIDPKTLSWVTRTMEPKEAVRHIERIAGFYTEPATLAAFELALEALKATG